MSRILCPVDFSEASLNAVEFAAHIACKFNARLTLVNVFTEEDFNQIVSEEELEGTFNDQIERASSRLAGIAEKINQDFEEYDAFPVDHEVITGELIKTLVDFSYQQDYSLIVMGTTGVGKSSWVGSKTSHFLSKVSIPVLCIPKESTYTGFTKLVYATDISSEDRKHIQEVISLATVFDARIYVVHMSKDANEVDEEKLTQFFEDLKSFIQYNKLSFNSKVILNSLSEDLLAYMNETKSEMLVVYSRQRSYFKNLVHKSLAKELSKVSNRPIFVLK